MATNFQPDYAALPGETLLETLDALGLSTSELAARTSLPELDIRAVADGRSPIGYDMARRFEEALKVPRDFWITLEQRYQERKLALDEAYRRRQRTKTVISGILLGAAAVAVIACPAFAIVFRRANAAEARTAVRVKEARIEGADEGYAAAEQPTQPAPAHTRGYVYLGVCEKTWISRKFGYLPACDESIPDQGKAIVSREGDVIRDSLPTTVNGHRKFGEPIGRISAATRVLLRSIHAVSTYPAGPQHYWGEVEIPEQQRIP